MEKINPIDLSSFDVGILSDTCRNCNCKGAFETSDNYGGIDKKTGSPIK